MSRPVVVDWHEMNARIIAYINATTTATITSQYSLKYLDSRFNLIILLWLFYFIIKFTLCGQFFLLCVILVLFLRFQCWNFYLPCVDKKDWVQGIVGSANAWIQLSGPSRFLALLGAGFWRFAADANINIARVTGDCVFGNVESVPSGVEVAAATEDPAEAAQI